MSSRLGEKKLPQRPEESVIELPQRPDLIECLILKRNWGCRRNHKIYEWVAARAQFDWTFCLQVRLRCRKGHKFMNDWMFCSEAKLSAVKAMRFKSVWVAAKAQFYWMLGHRLVATMARGGWNFRNGPSGNSAMAKRLIDWGAARQS